VNGSRPWLAVLGLTVLAAVLRFATLGHQSYWLDEAYTVHALHGSLGDVLRAVRHQESTPPVYYVLGWAWSKVFGLGPWGLRSLSALAGTLTVPVAYAIGARVARPRAGLVAAALLAVAPLAVWFSQEARAYALAMLLVALSLWCLVTALDDGGRWWWAGWGVLSAFALATHYFAAFVIGPEVVWVLVRARTRASAVAVATIAFAAVVLAPLALEQRSNGHAAYIGRLDLGRRVLQVPKQLLVGYAAPVQVLWTTLAVALVLAATYGLWRDPDRARRVRALALVGLVAVAGAVPVVLAVVGLDYVDARNLLPVLPIVAVVLGCGLTALDTAAWRVATAALATILLLVTVLGATSSRWQRDDWRGIVHAIGRPRAGRAVIVSPAAGWIALQVFDRGLEPMGPGAPIDEIDVVATAGRGADGAGRRPPRAGATFVVPPGFKPAGTTQTDTYTVVRLRSPQPVAVTPASLAATHLGAANGLALVGG
jgi:mannosyltransferase